MSKKKVNPVTKKQCLDKGGAWMGPSGGPYRCRMPEDDKKVKPYKKPELPNLSIKF